MDSVTFHRNQGPDCQFCLCPAVSEARYENQSARFCDNPACKAAAIQRVHELAAMASSEHYVWSGYTDLRKKLVSVARSLLGKPYKYGARPEDAPEYFDCSSFTQYVYRQIGHELPRSSILQAACAPKINFSNGSFKIGDLIFFSGGQGHYNDSLFPDELKRICIGHVAMYIGEAKLIHANGKTKSVAETTWNKLPELAVRTVRILP